MLVDLGDLLDDAEDGFEVPAVLEHADEDVFEVLLEEVLGLLRCLVLPLDDLVPDGPAELDHLDDEVQHCLRLARHHQRHRLQLPLRLALGDLQGQRVVLLLVLDDPQQDCEGFVEVDPNERLEVGLVGGFGEVVREDGEEVAEVLKVVCLFVEPADEDEDGLLDDWQR